MWNSVAWLSGGLVSTRLKVGLNALQVFSNLNKSMIAESLRVKQCSYLTLDLKNFH